MTDQTLAGKIAAASVDVGGKLSADKKNKEQNYDYLSADKILSICGQALAQQGVVIIPDIMAQEVNRLEYTDSYGKIKNRYDCRVDFLFHIHDGTTELVQKWYGMGSDYSVPDKALYKSITSGHKYFLMKLLCVGAGNEDSEHEEDAPKKPAPVVKVSPPTAPKYTPKEAETVNVLYPDGAPVVAAAQKLATEKPIRFTPSNIKLAVIGGNKGHGYPAPWVKDLMVKIVGAGKANEFELDGILQKIDLEPTTMPEIVVGAVESYLNAKEENGDAMAAVQDYLTACVDGKTENG